MLKKMSVGSQLVKKSFLFDEILQNTKNNLIVQSNDKVYVLPTNNCKITSFNTIEINGFPNIASFPAKFYL